MKRLLFIFGLFYFSISPTQGQKSRLYVTAFENIRFLDHKGVETKIHLVHRQGNHLYLISESNVLFDYDIIKKELRRYLIPTVNMRDVTAFGALNPRFFIFATGKQIYKIQLPSFYPYPFKNITLRDAVVQILPISSNAVVLVSEYALYILNPQQGVVRKIYSLPAGSRKFKSATITPDGRIRAITDVALVTVEFYDSKSKGRIRKIEGLKEVKGDNRGGVYLLTNSRLTILTANQKTLRITVQRTEHIAFDRINQIWLYGKENIYRIKNNRIEKIDVFKSNILYPILFLTEGLPGEVIIVSPRFLSIIHGLNSEDEYLNTLLAELQAQCKPLNAWPFYKQEVQALLLYLPHITSNSLKDQILNLLADGIAYLPEFQQQIISETLKLPVENDRQKILQKLANNLSGVAWPLAVYLEKERIKNHQSIEAKIRGEFQVGLLMAVDTVNYSLASFKLNNIFNQYENVIFNKQLRDSMIFMTLKYATQFPFNSSTSEEALWEKLAKTTNNPLLKRYAHYHFFSGNTLKYLQINPDKLWEIIPKRMAPGTELWLPGTAGDWLVKNSRLYYQPLQGRIKRFRHKVKILTYLQNTPIALTNDGKLIILKPRGPVPFQPAAPARFQTIWSSGSQLVAIRYGRRTELFHFNGEKGTWAGPIRLPAEIARERFIYAQLMNATEYLLVTNTRAYRLNRNSQQVLSLMVPAEILTIFDCERDSKGGFYFATNAGLWYRNVSGKWFNVSKKEGLTIQPVWDLALNFDKGVLGIVGPQQAAISDAFGWITWDLPEALQNQQSIRLQFDPKLNAVIYNGNQSMVWKRGEVDRKNLVYRLITITPDFLSRNKTGELLHLLQRAGRIPELSEWANAFQFAIYLQQNNLARAQEIVELTLGKPKNTGKWIQPIDGLILLDLYFLHQDWNAGIRALNRLFPLLKSPQVKSTYVEFLIQKLEEHGSSFMPVKKLELISQFAQHFLSGKQQRKVERIANGCLAYLWVQENKNISRILNRLTQQWPDSPMKNYWSFMQFLIAYRESRPKESRQIFLQRLKNSSNPLIRSRAGRQFLATSIALLTN